MNKLKIFERNGKLWTDSREVAAMVGKQHFHLVRDIRGYITVMEKSGESKNGLSDSGEPNFGPSDFFIESTYINEQNKEMPCFLCSKLGCEMIGNKLTGAKGVLFTAAYVSQFNEYEQSVNTVRLPNMDILPYLNGVANYLRAQRTIMKENGKTPGQIATMDKQTCEYIGLPLPEDFAAPQTDQLLIAGWTALGDSTLN